MKATVLLNVEVIVDSPVGVVENIKAPAPAVSAPEKTQFVFA